MSMTADNVARRAAYSARVKLDAPPHFYPPVLLEPGEYALAYAAHRLDRQFDRGVLAVYFAMVDDLPDIAVVARYYPVEIITTTTKKKTFAAKRASALVGDFRQLFPGRRLTRLDRIPMSWLAEQFIVGRIGTVMKDRAQKDYDENRRYSVVKELVRCQ